MNIITKRRWFFALSGLVLVPGLIALALFGLKFSIDFTGGSKLLIDPSQDSILQRNTIEDIYKKEGIEIHNIVEQGNEILIRSIPMSQKTKSLIGNGKIAV